jgi:hypothetical protein
MRDALSLTLVVAIWFGIPVLAPAAAQTAAKAARPAKKEKATARKPVEQRAPAPAERTPPAPPRDPLIDRSTGSSY